MTEPVLTSGSREPVRRVVLSLGSNLGDRLELLQGAVDALTDTPDLQVLAVSPVYETDPVGGPDQPDYFNAVVVAEGPHPARTLLERALAIENAFDRIRDVRWGPRTLDVDVISVTGDDGTPVLSDDPALTLPHPRAHERAFVLVPWLTLDPLAVLPGRGAVAELVRALPAEDVDAVVRWDHLH